MTINSDQFQEICNGVWRDRVTLIKGRGFLNGEAALVRAVYWRLSKFRSNHIACSESYSSARAASSYEIAVAALLELHGRPRFNGIQHLKELVQRYKNESK